MSIDARNIAENRACAYVGSGPARSEDILRSQDPQYVVYKLLLPPTVAASWRCLQTRQPEMMWRGAERRGNADQKHWGLSKTRRADSFLCPRTRWCLYSFDCQTHTPPRDRASPASQLNYSSLSPCCCLRDGWQQRHVFGILSPSPPDSNADPEPERTCVPDVLPNVLTWLNVLSENKEVKEKKTVWRGLCG